MRVVSQNPFDDKRKKHLPHYIMENTITLWEGLYRLIQIFSTVELEDEE